MHSCDWCCASTLREKKKEGTWNGNGVVGTRGTWCLVCYRFALLRRGGEKMLSKEPTPPPPALFSRRPVLHFGIGIGIGMCRLIGVNNMSSTLSFELLLNYLSTVVYSRTLCASWHQQLRVSRSECARTCAEQKKASNEAMSARLRK